MGYSQKKKKKKKKNTKTGIDKVRKDTVYGCKYTVLDMRNHEKEHSHKTQNE
jgi:hypothetical protein